MTAAALYAGRVTHTRLRPARHRLSYRVFMGLFDVDALESAAREVRLFGYNRTNLISFFDRDHGDGTGAALRPQIEKALATAGLPVCDGAMRVLCMPRVLGFVFNPLSVYLCYDRDEALRAVVHEVNNTYGERHFYALPADTDSEGRVRQACAKAFRVSPLLPMDLSYAFNIEAQPARISVVITVNDRMGPILVASFSGAERAFTSRGILRQWLAHPALTWKVVAGIHWEALTTFIKLKLAPQRANTPAR